MTKYLILGYAMQKESIINEALKIDGLLNADELDVLYYLVKDCVKDGAVLETGTFKGRSTYVIAETINGNLFQSVDAYGDGERRDEYVDYSFEVNKNKFKLYKNVQLINGKSTDSKIVKLYKSKYDLVFLDGDHTSGEFLKELEIFKERASVVAGHDFYLFNIKDCVNTFLLSNPDWELYVYEVGYGIFKLTKKKNEK